MISVYAKRTRDQRLVGARKRLERERLTSPRKLLCGGIARDHMKRCHPHPQTGALTELRYAPMSKSLVRLDIHAQGNETSRSVGWPHQPLAPTRIR
jgi:hypothetical protein